MQLVAEPLGYRYQSERDDERALRPLGRRSIGADLVARLPGTVRGRIPGLNIVAEQALAMFAELGLEVGNEFVGESSMEVGDAQHVASGQKSACAPGVGPVLDMNVD